jgi:ferric-dicitrate binding protein FerR (iron transport regulator)
MEMKNDDYLWNPSDPPDDEVERLERLLAPLRSDPRPFVVPEPSPRRRVRLAVPLLAAAAVLLAAVVLWRARPPQGAAWQVASLAGQPRIGASAIGETGRLAVGETLTTDAGSRARIDIDTIGEVEVAGDTRVRMVETGNGRYRLALDRGTLHAAISAPPGQFTVDTPSATAIDLGCVYTLRVDDDGTGLLSVSVGWVAFDFKGRESFVPAGASCRTDAHAGPGTPRFDDADHEFQMAVERFDFNRSDADRAAALRVILDRARARDAVTLWHLLARVGPSERGEVFDALSARVAPPAGVTRDRILALDRSALDEWWNALKLGDTSFWRQWKRQLPEVK